MSNPLTNGTVYKVIVWATGTIGQYAIKTIVDRPNLELVGVWVHSESKAGRDAGELAGMDPVGVLATNDADELLASDADAVIYLGPYPTRAKECRDDFVKILRAGKDLVTTAVPGLVYGHGSLLESFFQPIVDAAIDGGSTVFSSGVEPGFGCDLLPIALITMSHSVYSVRGLEITDYSEYPVVSDVHEMFGLGQPMDYQGGLRTPGLITMGWGAAVTMVGDALGVEFDEIRESCEFAPATRRVETASVVVEEGTAGAVWSRCIGMFDGQEVVTIEHIDRMAEDFAPDWPTGREGDVKGVWRVIVDGEPSIDCEFKVAHNPGENHSLQGLVATGMRALNAIPWVCEAEPGLTDALHLPLTPAYGSLRPNREGLHLF